MLAYPIWASTIALLIHARMHVASNPDAVAILNQAKHTLNLKQAGGLRYYPADMTVEN